MKRTLLRHCTLALTTLSLASCQLLQTKQAADSGFTAHPRNSSTRAWFLQESWVSPKYRGTPISSHFKTVYFAPVNTQYLAQQSWWQAQTPMRQSDMAADARKIATQMRHEFMTAAAGHPGHQLRLVSSPGPDTLIIELALVELVPSKAFWNAAASAAGFAVPGAGFLSVAGRGSIAIEGRARHGADRSVIATFKDRRTDKVAPVNLGAYTWYHGAERNITDWAAEFATFLNTRPDQAVLRTSSVTLMPW